jgi:nicotinate-nucleotide pyrophosphorylase (carboxylating)
LRLGYDQSTDLRDLIFHTILNKKVEAKIWTAERGVIAGIRRIVNKAKELGLKIEPNFSEGDLVEHNDIIAKITGTPKQIAVAEDILIGLIAKTSGIATAARKAANLSRGKMRIVCGAWKKMPYEIKNEIREAIKIGGVDIRISTDPFVYLDKNYIRMFGGIKEALEAVRVFDMVKVVQLKGETNEIEREALVAVSSGSDIVMIDTGRTEDITVVSEKLKDNGVRDSVRLAYAGSISLESITDLLNFDIDILDVGRAIIDAPILDIKLDVV